MRRTRFALALAAALMSLATAPAQQPRAGQVTGKVILLDGSSIGVAGVTVTLHLAGQGMLKTLVTNNDGMFAFEGLADGTYAVDVAFPYFEPMRKNGVVVADGRAAAPFTLGLRVSGICECVGQAPFAPGEWAEAPGRVLDAAGRPVPHALVELRTPAVPYTSSAYTALDGTFTAHLPIGKGATLAVSAPTFTKIERQLTGATLNASIEIRLSAGATPPVTDVETLPRGCRCPGDLLEHRVQ